MPQLQVAYKILKLTNVLIANINADDGDDLAFCNKINLYIKSKGHQPVGPLIQYTCAEKTESGELDLIVRFLRQVNGYIKHTEPPYTMQPVFRVPNCLYVRFIGPQNELNIAYQKLAVFAAAIQSAENNIAESQTQIASIDAQLSALKSGQEKYVVAAPASGTIHMLEDYKDGMVVQAGSAVATITPDNEGGLIEAYISSAEISRIHEGDSVEMEVNGLMQSVYGTISGTVTQISSNATTQEGSDGSSQLVFKVLIHPDTLYVISNRGDKVDLTNGMTVETRIQYKEVTYFDYVMKKLGVKIS